MHGLIESQKQYVASVKDTVLLRDIISVPLKWDELNN